MTVAVEKMPLLEWLGQGAKDVPGRITNIFPKDCALLIQPDDYPEVRVYFNYRHWPAEIKRRIPCGFPVRFDLAAQQYNPKRSINAKAVRPKGGK